MKEHHKNSISPTISTLADCSWRLRKFRTRTVPTEQSGKKVVRKHAASTPVAVQSFPPSVQWQVYQKASEIIRYHQGRNRQAREHHARQKRQRLRALGIDIEKSTCYIEDNT